jgi:hypothetical protein
MLMQHASGSRNLRAPQGDGQKVVEPPWRALPQVVASNREQHSQAEYDIQGRSLRELSTTARRALVTQAADYTSRYRNVPDHFRDAGALADAPFILAGHQPQLFHPGVWYKNFVLGALARQLDGVGVHLLIDSDLCRSASIRVPTGSIEQPRVEAVAYDEPAAEVPYEERSIQDLQTFRSFSDRAVSLMRPLVPDPMITSLWPLTLERNPQQSNLGLRLAQGRHALEETHHNDTLELPQSAVCQLPEFAWFVAHVLAHLPRFWSAHNEALAEYRHLHRLRNRAHPVPDLTEVDGWLEAPFWIWSADDPHRLPLFAQQAGNEMVITDRGSRTIRLPLSGERDAVAAVAQLVELSSRGIKIRTRALTTTLFARLVLSDLFLHGIGGAKYDQVTDQIARAFFGFTPPEFATVSATLRLPIAGNRLEHARERSCDEQLRELRFHPERFIDGRVQAAGAQSSLTDIISVKQRWVQTPKTPENARERHDAIEAANQSLQPYVAEQRQAIRNNCNELQNDKRAAAILQSREYSFCLYPRRYFESRLLDDLPQKP